MKTNELTGAALDWAVAKAEGYIGVALEVRTEEWYTPSTDWAQGGPIIERECIEIRRSFNSEQGTWQAIRQQFKNNKNGPTPLIAAMRCYVASRLGDEVEIPKELVRVAQSA